MSETQNNVVSLEDRARKAPTWGKNQLLADAMKPETHYFPEAQANITIRRLGSGEWAEVEALQASGIKLEGAPEEDFDQNDPNAAKKMNGLKLQIDVAETTRGEAKSRHLAVAYALSVNGEQWTEYEASKIPNIALTKAIGSKALELSGVSAEAQAEIRNFREQRGGGEPGVALDEGVQAGTESANADASAGDVLADSDESGGSEA